MIRKLCQIPPPRNRRQRHAQPRGRRPARQRGNAVPPPDGVATHENNFGIRVQLHHLRHKISRGQVCRGDEAGCCAADEFQAGLLIACVAGLVGLDPGSALVVVAHEDLRAAVENRAVEQLVEGHRHGDGACS